MKTIEIKTEEYESLKRKANAWNKLVADIGEFYEDYNDDGIEIPPKREGDLGDIGLVAAEATGYL